MTTGEPIGGGRGDGNFRQGMKRGAGSGLIRILVAVVLTFIPTSVGAYAFGDSSSDQCSISDQKDD